MNTESELPEDNQPSEEEIEPTADSPASLPEDEPWEDNEARPSALDGDFDVDAALASIATLSDLEDEDEEDEEDQDFESEYDESDDEDAYEPDSEQEVLPDVIPVRATVQPVNAPPIYDFSRGQLASIVPAITLMVYGAWLTFALSSDASPSFAEAFIFALIGIGVSLLGYWFSSGRIAAGSATVGLLLIGIPAAIYLIAQSDLPGRDEWPFIVIVIGAALFLSSFLSRNNPSRSGFTGLVLMVMGGFAYALISNSLDFDVDQSGEILLPVLGVILVVLLIAPLLPRRR